MPIDYTIPSTVENYLKIIEQLSELTKGHDSLAKESAIFQDEIKYYLNLIREEMKKSLQTGE